MDSYVAFDPTDLIPELCRKCFQLLVVEIVEADGDDQRLMINRSILQERLAFNRIAPL